MMRDINCVWQRGCVASTPLRSSLAAVEHHPPPRPGVSSPVPPRGMRLCGMRLCAVRCHGCC